MPVMPQVSRPLIALLIATVAFFALWLLALQPSSSSTGGGKSGGLGQYQGAINAAKATAAAQDRAAAANGTTVARPPSPSRTATHSAATKASPATKATTATKATPATKTASATKTATKTPSANHSAASAKPAHTTALAKPKHTTTPAKLATTHAKPHSAPVASKPTSATTPAERRNVVDRALAAHKVLALLFYNPAAPDDQAVRHELSSIPTSGGRVVKLAVPLSELAHYPVITNQVLVQTSPTLVIIDRSAQAFTLVGYADEFTIAHRVGDALSMH